MNTKYTAQDIIAISTPLEVAALERYFGPCWVYGALKDEEQKTRYGLDHESPTVELRVSKRAAREAWCAIKQAIDMLPTASTQNYDRACEFCGQPCWVDPDDRDAPQGYCTHCHLGGGEVVSTKEELRSGKEAS